MTSPGPGIINDVDPTGSPVRGMSCNHEAYCHVIQARHGGLLALKYLLAARPDAAADLLPDALPSAMLGLQVGDCIGLSAQLSCGASSICNIVFCAASFHQPCSYMFIMGWRCLRRR